MEHQQFSQYTLVLVFVSMELVITAGNLNAFQKSLRPLFHSPLQLFKLLHYANHHTHTQGNELSDQ